MSRFKLTWKKFRSPYKCGRAYCATLKLVRKLKLASREKAYRAEEIACKLKFKDEYP